MTRYKLVFLEYRHEQELEHLRKRAAENVDVVGVPPGTTPQQTAAACEDADVVIPWLVKFNIELARSAPKLKLVQTLSAGVDSLPLAELAEMGIPVANNFGSNAAAVAENTIWLIVGVYRQLHVQMQQLEAGTYHGDFFDRWEDFHELTGKRVGIIGLGQIGRNVARRLRGWDCEIVYHDVADISPAIEQAAGAKRLSLDELLRASDVITLHVPLTDLTRGMISEREFGLMKPSAILINTARGSIVDETALVRALDSNGIAGAGLDVTVVEPIPLDSPLIDRPNVVLTPHLAGLSIEARDRTLDFAIENVNRIAAGEQPLSVVQP